eukprot:5881905-Amphidinium_carterae.1
MQHTERMTILALGARVAAVKAFVSCSSFSRPIPTTDTLMQMESKCMIVCNSDAHSIQKYDAYG